jgi:hypothetical protein
MPLAKLRLTVPEEVWIGDLTRQFPEVVIRILAAFSDEEAGVGLAEVEGDSVPELVTRMSEYEDVSHVDVIQHSESKAIVQFETTMPLLLLPARDSGVPLEMPFEIQDGEVNWEVTAPNDRLSALGEQLDTFGIAFTVDRIQQRITDEQLLTERQQRLVEAAVDEGYYDTPRGVSLTELADEVGIAKSTASETLHRAEEAIVKDFVENLQTMQAAD